MFLAPAVRGSVETTQGEYFMRARSVLVIALLAIPATEATALLLHPALSSFSRVCPAADPFHCPFIQPPDTVVSGTPVLEKSASGSISIAPGTDASTLVDFSTHERSTYGTLQAFAFLNEGGIDGSPSMIASSSSEFLDELTFTGGSGPGIAYFDFLVEGYGAGTPDPAPFGGGVGISSLRYYFGPLGGPGTATVVDMTARGVKQEIVSMPVPFVYDVPVDIQMLIWVDAEVLCAPNGIPGGGPDCNLWQGASTTNFYDTAVLNGIQVTDAAGNSVNNFAISSASGQMYSANGIGTIATIPEPSTPMLLLIAGVGMLSGFRSRIFVRQGRTPT